MTSFVSIAAITMRVEFAKHISMRTSGPHDAALVIACKLLVRPLYHHVLSTFCLVKSLQSGQMSTFL